MLRSRDLEREKRISQILDGIQVDGPLEQEALDALIPEMD